MSAIQARLNAPAASDTIKRETVLKDVQQNERMVKNQTSDITLITEDTRKAKKEDRNDNLAMNRETLLLA